MKTILKISNLKGGYKAGVPILNGISLSLKEGEILGVIGLNGSGKSTLGRAIINTLPIREGNITYMGKSVNELSCAELSNRGIAMMLQGGAVFKNLSVWENLQLALSKSKKEQLELIKSVIPMSPLFERKNFKAISKRRMADKLSGGLRHQLSLAMILLTGAKVVILDEPSAGLSPKAVDEMYSIIKLLKSKTNLSIILIEQNIAKCLEFSDRSILIQQGKILKEFSRGDVESIEKLMFETT